MRDATQLLIMPRKRGYALQNAAQVTDKAPGWDDIPPSRRGCDAFATFAPHMILHRGNILRHTPPNCVVLETRFCQSPCILPSSMHKTQGRKSKLLDQVGQVIRRKGYSICTEGAYVAWVKRFILFQHK